MWWIVLDRVRDERDDLIGKADGNARFSSSVADEAKDLISHGSGQVWVVFPKHHGEVEGAGTFSSGITVHHSSNTTVEGEDVVGREVSMDKI